MQFLKLLFWCLMAFLAAVFTFGNWTNISIQLFGGLVAEVNLPLLLVATFLLGFVPTLIYQHWVRFRLRQRLTVAERALETERALAAARTGEMVAPTSVTPAAPPPPAAVPTAVPPGVA
jgi:putative membrane protein